MPYFRFDFFRGLVLAPVACGLACSLLLWLPLAAWGQEPEVPVAKDETAEVETAEADPAETSGEPDGAPISPERRERIEKLIGQLGHNNFTIRERAQTELSRMGVDAFDMVYESMRDDDPEVARRAQYLIRSIEIDWVLPEFDDEVKALLNKYGNQGLDNRRSHILQLANLGTLDAARALARISRYEASEILSKEAALALALNFERLDGPTLAETVTEYSGGSPRTGPRWLDVFSESLSEPAEAVEKWRTFVQDEAANFSGKPSVTSWHMILDLVRWEVRQLRALDRQEKALQSMRELARISVNFSDSELIDLTTWLLEHDGGQVVEELAQLHAQANGEAADENGVPGLKGGRFASDPNMLYLLAEAILVQSRPEEAQKLADQALKMAPDSRDSHRLLGNQLAERGLFRWAEQEYRQAFKDLDAVNPVSITARAQLAEMLHDMQDDAKAVEVLKPMADALEQLKGTGHQLDPGSNDYIKSRIARYYLFQAHVAKQQGDKDQTKNHLRKAVEYDETESDSLIFMYALDDDPDWQKEVKTKIDSYLQFYKPVVERFQESIEFFKRNARGRDVMGSDRGQMAMYMNQYAWLVGNTYGDLDHAIEASHLSLELRPGEGAYLDTLAHCYATKKDYAEAVKYQAQALKQMPYSGQIRNAYTWFADLHEEHIGPFDRIELSDPPDSYFEK